MKKALLPILLAVASCFGACQTEIRYLLDDQGRETVLHGLNVSNNAKTAAGGLGWHTQADFQRMQDWGFNVVRLLIFWSHLEPQPGQIDSAYLDRVADRVDWAHAAGLQVVLDAHQDLYGPKFGGDGAPEWATWDDGLPFFPLDLWWLNYLQAPVRAAFSHLWNDPGLQDHYAQAWAAVAERFGNHPAVIGYDLMNEPFYGNEGIGYFENHKLAPFYRSVSAAIRTKDPDARIFFEPVALATASGLPSQMDAYGDTNAVYFPHYYDPIVHEGIGYFGAPWLLDLVLSIKAREADRHGVPLMIGEFGASPNTPAYEAYLDQLMASMDRYASGWMAWSYDRSNDIGNTSGDFGVIDAAGNERGNLLHMIRTYPQAVAGRIEEYFYDPSRQWFELRYSNRAGVQGPTEIHVPERFHYAQGFQVFSSDPPGTWSWQWDPQRQVVSVWHDPQSENHLIQIRP
ncbi:MAG: glycoside hydrolase family 5 protein [Planctomycetota bacterium]|nr:MAG: glycoside hydrolase family 5 protein [Planctomycetota bacterium]